MAEQRRNHIVPRGYLRQFAVDDRIDAHVVGGGPVRRISTRDAAVRKSFYVLRRTRGLRSTDLEASLSDMEGKALRVIHRVDDRWPLSENDKALLTEFLAVQVVRSPSWRQFFYRTASRSVRDWVDEREGLPGGPQTDDLIAYVTADPLMAARLYRHVRVLGTIIGSMHATLLVFGSGRLLTSDQPVVLIPEQGGHSVAPLPLEGGMAGVVELWFPLRHDRALLLLWKDDADNPSPHRASPQLARIINKRVAGQADVHWFSRPGDRPSTLAPPSTIRTLRGLVYPRADEIVNERSQVREQALLAATKIPLGAESRGHPLTRVRPGLGPLDAP